MRIFAESVAPAVLEAARERIRTTLSPVRHAFAFASLKGGTGKSAMAVNCAVALALEGRKVAIVDADLNAPSILPMFAMKPPRSLPMVEGIEPVAGPHGLKIVSSAMIPGGEPPLFNPFADETNGAEAPANPAPRIGSFDAIVRMLSQARIGAVDTLVIDLAPGLDHALDLSQLAPSIPVVFVTNPSEHATNALRHGFQAAAASGVRVIGVIENMAGYHCDGCRSVRPLWPEGSLASAVRDVASRVLGRIPFEPRVAECCDRGVPFVRLYGDTPTAHGIKEICVNIESALGAISRPAVLA